jgi:hypothetical protein
MFCALDADDVLAPTWFEKSVGMLDAHPDLAFVSHWLETFGDEHWVWQPSSCELKSLLIRNTVNGAALVRRSAFDAVGGYDESMREGCEDWDFWLRLVERGLTGTIIPEILFYYRRRAASMSRQMLEPGAYVKPLTVLAHKHASAYRSHLTDVLLSKEVESVALFREVWNLQRDWIATTAPALSRAIEERDAASAKVAAIARLDSRCLSRPPHVLEQQRLLEEKISTLEAAVGADRQHATNLEDLLGESRQHAENLEQRIRELAPHATALEHRVTELSSHAANLESECAELKRWVDSLHRERDEALERLAGAQAGTSALRAEVNALRNSYSWVATGPLRTLLGWVARFR